MAPAPQTQPETQPDPWQRKYYDALLQLERREEDWRAWDTLLRRAVSRLSLLGDGLDPELDERLARLRAQVRGERDRERLHYLVEAVLDRAEALPRRSGPPTERAGPSDPLAGLRGILERLPVPPSRREALDHLIAELEGLDAGDPRAREAWTRRLAALLGEAAAGDGEAGEPGHRVLLQLLEALDLPEALAEQAERIRAALAEAPRGRRLARLVRAVAGLVGELHRRWQRERRATEKFLRRFTGHLQVLDRGLRGAEGDRRDALASSRRLQAGVHAEVEGLADRVAQEGDLATLRRAAGRHLAAIREQLERYKREEARREEAAARRIAQLTRRLQEMEGESEALRRRVEQARRQALRDPLTGLPNRLALEEALRAAAARRDEDGAPLSLVIWDLDHFKRINDRYGHPAGDRVLKTLGEMLAVGLRENDFSARYGGEEFVSLLPATPLRGGLAVAEQFRRRVAEARFVHQGEEVEVTLSCGVAAFRPGEAPEAVLERADRALYQAKAAGRNCCVALES